METAVDQATITTLIFNLRTRVTKRNKLTVARDRLTGRPDIGIIFKFEFTSICPLAYIFVSIRGPSMKTLASMSLATLATMAAHGEARGYGDDATGKLIRPTSCDKPLTQAFARYGESQTGDFDFSSTELSFSHDRLIWGRYDQERDCNEGPWDISVEGFLSVSESDFSDGKSANLGVGLKFYWNDNKGAITGFIRGGASDFDADGSQIGNLGADLSISNGYNLGGTANRFVLQHFTRVGYVSSNSISRNDFGQEFENDFTYVSNSIALDYGFGEAAGNNLYLADSTRLRLEMSVEDKIDSSEFDVNKIYGAEMSLNRTEGFRSTFRVAGQYRWGSDDFEGFVISISRQF